MAVADASVIAHRTGVVFVVGAEMTGRGAAQPLAPSSTRQKRSSAACRSRGRAAARLLLLRHYRREYQNYYSKGAEESSGTRALAGRSEQENLTRPCVASSER